MSNFLDVFNNGLKSINPNVPELTDHRGIDLRLELKKILYGWGAESGKAQKVIFRRAKRDTNNKIIKCNCVDETSQEPDKDHYCPHCRGIGHLFEEEWIDVYRVPMQKNLGQARGMDFIKPGDVYPFLYVFYLQYFIEPTLEDRIVIPDTDIEGNIKLPIKRLEQYKPQSVTPHKADNGRVEFWGFYSVVDLIDSKWKGTHEI